MDLVEQHDGKPVTTSIKVSEFFGKQHKNVLRDIEILLQNAEVSGRLNFEPSSYTNDQNKQQPMYEMDRDGFTLIAMGFTGKKALQFKMKYIDAFNAAEKALTTMVPTSPLQLAAFSAMIRVNSEPLADIAKSSLYSQTTLNILIDPPGKPPHEQQAT